MLKTKKKETNQLEIFKAKNPEFTQEPLPKHLLVPEIEAFVRFLSFDVYPDQQYVMNILQPHFEESVNKIKPYLAEMREELDNVKKCVIDQKPLPTKFKYKCHFMNDEAWRKYRAIYPIYQHLKNNLTSTRVSILSKRIDMLDALLNLAIHLSEHPRYMHLNIGIALQSWRSIELSFMPQLFIQFRSAELALADLKKQLNFIPHPFSEKESNQQFVRQIISAGMLLKDPESGYLSHIDEYDLFSHFLHSSKSPFKIPKSPPDNINEFLQTIVDSLSAFIELPSESQAEKQILYSYSTRFIFDEYCLFNSMKSTESNLSNIIFAFHSKKIQDIGVSFEFIPEKFSSNDSWGLFETTPMLTSVISQFTSCLFLPNPIDIAHVIHLISLSMAGAIAQWNSRNLEMANSFDGLFNMWKVLFIASQLPYPDALFDFIQQWESLVSMPPQYINICRVPRAVILTFLGK